MVWPLNRKSKDQSEEDDFFVRSSEEISKMDSDQGFDQQDDKVDTAELADQNEELPPEVQEYYESTERDRGGKNWLLGLGTMLLTLLIASGLFFGGRFVYRQFSGNNDAAETAQNNTNTNTTITGEEKTQSTGDTEVDADDSEASDNTGSQLDSSQGSDEESQSSSESNSEDQEFGSQEVTTTVTGDSEITNSGPGSSLAVFVATSALATLAYQVAARKKALN